MDEALAHLLTQGALGPVVIGLGVALWRVHQALAKTQEKRVQDAQKTVERILALTESIDGLADAVEELRREIERRYMNGR